MSARASSKLYTPDLLALATGLADYPLTDTLSHRAEARSRSCGSVIAIGLALDAAGLVADIGLKVSACAIGQASAAVLARSVKGCDPAQISDTIAGLEAWLAGAGDLPRWPGIEALAPALAHPGRHGALLLPWKAACEALSQASTAR